MTMIEVARALLAGVTGIPRERILTGEMNEDEWDRIVLAADELSRLPIYLGNEMARDF